MFFRSRWLPLITALVLTYGLYGCTPQPDWIDRSHIRMTPVDFGRKPHPVPDYQAPPTPAPGPTAGLPRIPGIHIVVDPGHGGSDPGAPAAFRGALPEKTIVLMIANRLTQVLRACGAKVTQTRTDDTFVELNERAAISNRLKADLFVSIHADAAENGKAVGTTLYVEPNAYWRTIAIARSIQWAFTRAGIRCRGVNQEEEFRILVKNQRPAILIETGYMTNSLDAQRLNSNWYQKKIAMEIARGITAYFNR